MKCLTENDLLAWLDGGVSSNEVESFERHLQSCPSCRDARREAVLLADDLSATPNVDVSDAALDRHVARVMARLEDHPGSVSGPSRIRPAWFGRTLAMASGVIAIAAAVALLWRPLSPNATQSATGAGDGFVARGGTEAPSLKRDVGIRMLHGGARLERLAAGESIFHDSPLSASFVNLYPAPVYLLTFGVDAAGEVHWLYPAYLDKAVDPASVELPRTQVEAPLSTSVILDHPAQGALRLVSIVSQTPLHVSDVDPLPTEALEHGALERRFATASVTEMQVRVVPR